MKYVAKTNISEYLLHVIEGLHGNQIWVIYLKKYITRTFKVFITNITYF